MHVKETLDICLKICLRYIINVQHFFRGINLYVKKITHTFLFGGNNFFRGTNKQIMHAHYFATANHVLVPLQCPKE